MQDGGSPLVFCLCALGSGRALIYDAMRNPILASKFNLLQLFSYCMSSPEAGFRNRDIKAFPPEHL